MPDYFSHMAAAKIIYENCPKDVKEKIENFTAYLLGAQGGDVFFLYDIHFTKTNLGRAMHGAYAADLFEKLSFGDKSYLAGFATHYALDSGLHPAVYAFEAGAKSPFAHGKFENDLGLYISRKYSIPRNILPAERVLAQTYTVYDSVKNAYPVVTLTGVERCLKRHFYYTRRLLKTKKTRYNFAFDYSSLDGAVEDALSFGKTCVISALSGSFGGGIFDKSFLER